MDKIMTYAFIFPNGNMFCVGADWAIKDLYNNFIIQKESGNNISLDNWCKRILKNKIYCRFEPKGLQGFGIFLSYFFIMKKHQLWMTEEAYDEALFLANQEKVSELLGLTKEESEKIKNNSIWNGKFLY